MQLSTLAPMPQRHKIFILRKLTHMSQEGSVSTKICISTQRGVPGHVVRRSSISFMELQS